MPIARYFVVVGSALVVLLLVAGWSLPESPPSFSDRPEVIERAAIRIRSERKWPDKVVLDTSQPTFPTSSIEMAQAEESAGYLPDEMTGLTGAEALADAIARPKPDVRPMVAYPPPMRARRKKVRAFRSLHVARARSPNELQGEACCWFEPTDRRTMSRAGTARRVARHGSRTGFLEAE